MGSAAFTASTPKGLRHKAQGSPVFGLPWVKRITSTTPKRGCVGCGKMISSRRNPVGVELINELLTQGSSFRATLGFETERLWRSLLNCRNDHATKRALKSLRFQRSVCAVMFGRFILLTFAAICLSGCDRKPIPVTPNQTNLTIPAQFVPPPEPTQAQPKLETVKIFVAEKEELDAEMALTFDQQRTGMMFRTNLTDSDAMIFVLPFTQRASFWMKNCPESLSAAYINPDGVIEEIRHLEKQDTNSVVAASENIRFVLEVKDGWFERHGISTGAVVRTKFGPLKDVFLRR